MSKTPHILARWAGAGVGPGGGETVRGRKRPTEAGASVEGGAPQPHREKIAPAVCRTSHGWAHDASSVTLSHHPPLPPRPPHAGGGDTAIGSTGADPSVLIGAAAPSPAHPTRGPPPTRAAVTRAWAKNDVAPSHPHPPHTQGRRAPGGQAVANGSADVNASPQGGV